MRATMVTIKDNKTMLILNILDHFFVVDISLFPVKTIVVKLK